VRENLGGRIPIIYISHDAKQRLDLYIEYAPGEISGLGKVVKFGENLLVTDVYLFEQETSPASTSLGQEDVAKFLTHWVQKGLDPAELKLWWHSHDQLDLFWSVTDEETIQMFDVNWMVSIVGNKYNQYMARLDLKDPCKIILD
jgi:hypothetical protein